MDGAYVRANPAEPYLLKERLKNEIRRLLLVQKTVYKFVIHLKNGSTAYRESLKQYELTENIDDQLDFYAELEFFDASTAYFSALT